MSIYDNFDHEPEPMTPLKGDIFIACALLIICVLSAMGIWAVKVKVGL